MSEQWFFAQGGQRQGPIATNELKSRLASGRVSATALVWREGMPDWVEAGAVPELAGIVASAPAPPALPPPPLPASPASSPAANPAYGAAPPHAAPYAPHPAALGPAPALIPAPHGARFVAGLLDSVVLIVASCALSAVTGGVSAPLVGIVLVAGYYGYFESSEQQATPGKKLMNLKVVDMKGNRITPGTAIIRYFAKYLSSFLLLIGYIMILFTEKHQGLHDKIADTLVVRG